MAALTLSVSHQFQILQMNQTTVPETASVESDRCGERSVGTLAAGGQNWGVRF